MGRPFRGYIGFGTNQTSYNAFNAAKGIASFGDISLNQSGTTIVTGGTIIPSASSPDGYVYHVFTGSGSFDVIGATSIDLMMIAGGGGGGGRIGGGGGAGGYLYLPNIPFSNLTGTIVIGGGGAADPVTYPNAGQGTEQRGESTTFTATGILYKAWGGGGGAADNLGTATAGGSGGGGATNAGSTGKPGLNPATPSAIITSDFPGESHPYVYTQGYNGGANTPKSGGGGGAGGAGSSPTGVGGVGKIGDLPMPASYGTPGPSAGRWFAGGGGATNYSHTGGAAGGAGGGGKGSPGATADGVSGTVNTGGGGGGAGQTSGDSGSGGAGLCVIRIL